MVSLPIFASLWILCVGQEDDIRAQSQSQLPTNVDINTFKVRHEEALLLQVVSEHDGKSSSQFEAVSIADLTRARQAFPSAQFTAKSAKEIRKMLNHHLRSGKLSMPLAQPCEEFSLKELGLIQQQLATCSNQELWSFASAGSRAPRHDSSSKLAADIIYWDEYVQSHPDVTEAVRDGRCHEVALQWVHHLTDSTRLAFSTYSNISMPLLPKNLENHTFLLAQHPGVKVLLNEQVSCQTAHSSESLGYEGHDADWPVWPNELTYEATAYGLYPFWNLGKLGSLEETFALNMSKSGHLRTYFSGTHNQARYDHSECPSLPDGLQFGNFPLKNMPAGPCTNLFLGDGTGFLYSRVSDRSFCCMTSRPVGQGPCRLTAVSPNFIDKFDFIHDFNYTAESGSYEGLAKLYARKGPDTFPIWFWYVTTLEGLPVEQGEGYCLMYGPDGTRKCTDESSINHAVVFHQYHPETVERWEYNSNVFNVPEVCMGDIGLCGAQFPKGVGSVMCVQDYDAGFPVEYDDPTIWANKTVTYKDSLKWSELDQMETM